MDTKALAKSKGAHSLRHTKKNNHHPPAKVPSASSATATANKKPAGVQVGENPRKPRGSRALPSNSDRYDEEFNMGSEDPWGETTSATTDFVAPKSKGADYAFLISEAKAQPPSNYSSDIFHSLSDNIQDFTQGFGPMLSVEGQSMLSWISDGGFDFDFYFDEKASSSYEAPFLSLDLNALAKQLGKAKLSERLFLEQDVLLPPELLNDGLQACGEDDDNVQTRASAFEIDSEVSSSLIQDMDENETGQPFSHSESMSPSSSVASISVLKEVLCSMDQNKNKVGHSQEPEWKSISRPNVDQSQETEQKSISKPKVASTARKPYTFEAANAEADLNMLLNSFAETKFLEPTPKKFGQRYEGIGEKTPIMSSEGISSMQYASADIKKKSTDRTRTPVSLSAVTSVNIDDDTDTRPKETSNVVKIYGESFSETQTFQDITSLQSKANLQDDFDSWLDSI